MKGVKVATKILEKRFNKNTELYKEFRLFNAIAKSSIDNTEIAAAILTESKQAARRTNTHQINKEKSALIRDINYNIKDDKFYYRSIPQYSDYAAIQNLINEWRKCDRSDLKKLVILEKRAIDLLMKEKIEKDVFVEQRNLEASDSNRLVIKIMTEKINEKYADMLPEQKEIIKNYALYGTDDKSFLVKFLKERKMACLDVLKEFKNINENIYISPKIEKVKNKIKELNENEITDSSMIKFLTITKLLSEIKGN